MRITGLRKVPQSEEYITSWCGRGVEPFPVPLTEQDWECLQPTKAGAKPGVWSHLPAVILPMDELAWAPYRAAIEIAPPDGWILEEDTEAPWAVQMFRHRGVERDIRIEVVNAATSGKIRPLSPASFMPRPNANVDGDLLWSCILSLEDFTAFANCLKCGVIVSPDHSHMARIKEPAAVKPKQRAQEERIIDLLNFAGYRSGALPERAEGSSGVKAVIKSTALAERPSLFSSNSFDKAWQRLRSDGLISGG